MNLAFANNVQLAECWILLQGIGGTLVIKVEEIIDVVEVAVVLRCDVAVELAPVTFELLRDLEAQALDKLPATVTGGVQADLSLIRHDDSRTLALEFRMLLLEIIEGLLRFLDKLVAFFLLVYSAGDLVDLIPPWDLPVRGTVWLDGGRGNVVKDRLS